MMTYLFDLLVGSGLFPVSNRWDGLVTFVRPLGLADQTIRCCASFTRVCGCGIWASIYLDKNYTTM